MALKRLKETPKIVKIGTVGGLIGCGLYCYYTYHCNQEKSSDDKEMKILRCYENLLKMGFDEKVSLSAAKQFKGDINSAMSHIVSINKIEINKNEEKCHLEDDEEHNADDVHQSLFIETINAGFDGLSKQITNTTHYNECSEDINACFHVQRVLLTLKFHQKQTAKSMSEYLLNFRDYDEIKIMKDFIHFNKFHIANIMELTKYNTLQCQSKHCHIMRRHVLRNRNTRKRDKEKELSLKQLNSLQYLDTIHCTLCHQTEDMISINQNNKFLTTTTQNDYIDGDEEKHTENNKMVYPKYTFGLQFTYWNKKRQNYVPSKFNSLKEEYLSNSLHKISLQQFELLREESMDFVQIYKDNMVRAKREFSWHQGAIRLNSEMSVEHIMVIKSYCNFDEMQRNYKNGCKKHQNDIYWQHAMRRNSEIAIWCKLFKETVCCFGNIFNNDDYVYHGLDRKFSFNTMGTQFDLPTSCTRTLDVAQGFTNNNMENGIIIKLQRSESFEQSNYYLDVYSKYLFSALPWEEENILFGATLVFKDIIYEDIHNKLGHSEYISSLSLFYHIIQGNWFVHNKDIFNPQNEEILIKSMNQMMRKDNNNTICEFDPYLIHLFETMANEGSKYFLNKNEFDTLSLVFRNVFVKFIEFVTIKHGIIWEYTNNLVSMNLSREQILRAKQVYDGAIKGSIMSKPYTYELNDDGDRKLICKLTQQPFIPNKLKLQFCLFFNQNGESANVIFGIYKFEGNFECYDYIEVGYRLWIPQIQFALYASSKLSIQRMASGHNLFDLSLIESLNVLNIHISFQILDYQYKSIKFNIL